MSIKGFQGTSLLDFPGRIASLVFFGGCNLTCPYCHNPGLVLDPGQYPDYPVEALLDELQARRRFIDGVVVSGGEPTLNPGLLPFLRQVKELGLAVKLDTNGLAPPAVLELALAEGLVDYVALDLKTDPARYGVLHHSPVPLGGLLQSVRLLLEGTVDYELRTTCVPGLVQEADIHAIGELVRGARRWVLQQFVPGHALAEELREIEPHPAATIRALAAVAAGYVGEVGVRGL
jgi:pyruvate formate lyase activating enzyme